MLNEIITMNFHLPKDKNFSKSVESSAKKIAPKANEIDEKREIPGVLDDMAAFWTPGITISQKYGGWADCIGCNVALK